MLSAAHSCHYIARGASCSSRVFPSVVLRRSFCELGESRTQSSHADDKRLVVLIGWLGSKQRHFEKYVNLWKEMGHCTVSTRPTTSSIVLPRLGDMAAEEFLRSIHFAQLRQPSLPVLYHIFSNAGFIFYGTMLRSLALQDPGLSSRVFDRAPPSAAASSAPLDMLNATCGIIIDSAPSRLTANIASRGLTAAVLGEPADSIERRHPYLTGAAKLALKPVLGFPVISRRIKEVWAAWGVVAPVRPQLYLYSAADALIPAQEAELFMQQQAARGVQVHSRKWLDSPHCEHLRWHPQEYKAELQSFLTATQ